LKSAQAKSNLLRTQETTKKSASSARQFFSKEAVRYSKKINDILNTTLKSENQNPHVWQDKLLEAQDLMVTSKKGISENNVRGSSFPRI
jgi:hypothetical protein